jgi:hypothetical protein
MRFEALEALFEKGSLPAPGSRGLDPSLPITASSEQLAESSQYEPGCAPNPAG